MGFACGEKHTYQKKTDIFRADSLSYKIRNL